MSTVHKNTWQRDQTRSFSLSYDAIIGFDDHDKLEAWSW